MISINAKAPIEIWLVSIKVYKFEIHSDFKGKKIVLYFYPKDSTAGCTKQALGFAEYNEVFRNNNIVIIGINKDSVASHARFAEKYSLPFILPSLYSL